MILRHGNMFDHQEEAKVLVVTTNNTITSTGKLVMGRGAAKDLRDSFPGIDKHFGTYISLHKKLGNTEDYLFITYYYYIYGGSKILGALQVKRHYKDPADLNLIYKSLESFRFYVDGMLGACPDCLIFLNFPGIGNGKLEKHREDILKRLEKFPDNLHVWEL